MSNKFIIIVTVTEKIKKLLTVILTVTGKP